MKFNGIKSRLLTGAVLAMAGAAFATAAVAQGAPKRGGTLIMAVQQDISGFNNLKVLSFAHFRQYILAAIYERMFEIDEDTKEIKPIHALSAKPSDDFKRWRVKLRGGVKFSNGEDLNADAYVTHFQRLLGGSRAGRYRRLMGPRLDHVEKVDSHTVDFVFTQASPGFLNMAAQPNMSWWVTAPKYLKANAKKPEFNANPVGAGPYMLKEWKDGAFVRLVRNPHYWNKKVQHLDEIRVMFIPPEASRVNSLRAGTVDIIYVSRGFLKRLKADKNIVVKSGPRLSVGQAIGFNHSKPPFNDIRIRRALIHALDRDALTCAATGVCAPKAANDMFGEGHPWHCPNVKQAEYNPAKAKALIDEYVKEKGTPVRFNVDHFPNQIAIKNVSAMIDMWKKVGVSATQKAGPRGPGFIRPLLGGKFDIFTFVENFTNADPSLTATRFHSKHPSSRQFHLKNAAIDKAVDAVNSAKGRDQRYKASCNYQQVLADQAALIVHDHPRMHVAHWKHVGGVKKPFGYTFNIHRMWVDKK